MELEIKMTKEKREEVYNQIQKHFPQFDNMTLLQFEETDFIQFLILKHGAYIQEMKCCEVL
jgi:CRISPR/Cas system-associated protein endoribonuclease Cas2